MKKIANIPLSDLIYILNSYMDQQVADSIWDLVSCLEITLERTGDIEVAKTLEDIKGLW